MDLKLTGKTCLVTGASAGIGVGIARSVAREGVRLAILARRRDPMEVLADEIEGETGVRPVIIVADLTTPDAPATVQAAIQAAFGGLDILVNNAGLSSKPEVIARDEVWNAGFDLKFTTLRRLTNAFLPGMRAQGWGRIVNITGIVEPYATSAALTACAAVHAWSKGLSRDVGKHGITLHCVQPGRIMSEQIVAHDPTEEARREFAQREIPVGRFGNPEELADVVTFLASPRTNYMTGTVIPVDGGIKRYAH